MRVLSRRADEKIFPAGDEMLLGTCETVENLKLDYSRKRGGRCYKEFPILDRKNSSFLRLPDHRIVKKANAIKCEDRKLVLIRTEGNNTIIVLKNGTTKTTVMEDKSEEIIREIGELTGIASEIIHDHDKLLHPLALLEIVSEVAKPLQDLNQIHQLGDENVLVGVGRAVAAVVTVATKSSGWLLKKMGETISDLVENVADGSSKIVTSTTKGAARIVDSAGGAVEKVELGFSGIVEKFLGGFLPVCNTLAVLGIIAYLYYKHRGIQKLELVDM